MCRNFAGQRRVAWNIQSPETEKFATKVPIVAQQWQTWLVTMRKQVWSLASLRELRIQRCFELWCRLQTWLRSDTAVGVASSCSFNSPLAWELLYAKGVALKSKRKKKKEKKTLQLRILYLARLSFRKEREIKSFSSKNYK